MSGLLGGLIEAVRRLFRRPEAAEPPMMFGYADLRAGGSRIAIIPRLGGRISALELGGREWLFTNSAMKLTPVPGVVSHELAGFDECFPTSAACTVPSWVHRFGGTALPERGELWTQQPEFEIHTAGRPTAITTWKGERMPYELRRTIQVTSDGMLTFDYVAINRGRDPIPFVWSPQPILPLTPRTRVILPDGILARVAAQHGIELGGGAREQRWPRFRLGDRLVDMSQPDSVASRYACKLFFDMPDYPVAVDEGDVRFEISANPRDVPHLGLWINRGGVATGRQSARVLSLQPCLGAPDSLAEALGDWKGVQWLAPDAVREWRFTLRARLLSSETRPARETPAESRRQSR